MRYFGFVFMVVLLSAAQLVLVLSGVLQPLSSNSLGNLLFILAYLMAVSCMGCVMAGEGLKKVALKGAGLASANVMVLVLAQLAGLYLQRPVLGVSVASTYQLLVLFTINAVFNILFGAFIATCAAWFARKIR